MKAESIQKAEQALNKIASAQLLLEAIDDSEFGEAIEALCRAYDIISDRVSPPQPQNGVMEGLGPEFLKALMEQMIDKAKNE